MKEQLRAALQSIASGNVEAVEPVVRQVKQLERGAGGLFEMDSIDDNLFEAARLVYPVYAAYETECNKKEGYPDLLGQLRQLKKELEKADTLENTAFFLDTLIRVIDNMSPQLYEYYRELVDLFKETVKDAVKKYYRGGHFTQVAYMAQKDKDGQGHCMAQRDKDGQEVCAGQEDKGGQETCGEQNSSKSQKDCEMQGGSEAREAEKLLREAIAHAAAIHVLLGEKYELYF